MQKKIKRVGDKYQVESEGGKKMGEYDTKAGANRRIRQIEHFKTLNKAIIETDFVKTFPQYVNEMKEEMKFENKSQPEAEFSIAKKYKLVDKMENKRWMRTLKVAGPVTSTTAGLEAKPRYGRKKKKEEEYVE